MHHSRSLARSPQPSALCPPSLRHEPEGMHELSEARAACCTSILPVLHSSSRRHQCHSYYSLLHFTLRCLAPPNQLPPFSSMPSASGHFTRKDAPRVTHCYVDSAVGSSNLKPTCRLRASGCGIEGRGSLNGNANSQLGPAYSACHVRQMRAANPAVVRRARNRGPLLALPCLASQW